MGRLKSYNFQHKKEDYYVDWKESDRVLTLTFFSGEGKELGTRDIKLLGVINQEQLDALVKDYWKNFKKNNL